MLYPYSGSSFSRADEFQSVLSFPAVSIPVIPARPRPCDAVSLPTVYCTFRLACHAFPRACDVQIFKFQTVPAFQLSRVRRFLSFLPSRRQCAAGPCRLVSFFDCLNDTICLSICQHIFLLILLLFCFAQKTAGLMPSRLNFSCAFCTISAV